MMDGGRLLRLERLRWLTGFQYAFDIEYAQFREKSLHLDMEARVRAIASQRMRSRLCCTRASAFYSTTSDVTTVIGHIFC